MKKIKYVIAQPLMGGMGLGFQRAFNCPPKAIITCGCSNDKHYIDYLNKTNGYNVPVINMDGEYKEFNTPKDHELFDKLVKEGVDVFVSVPICSGLSLLNSNTNPESTKRRGDPNNDQNQNMYRLNSLGMEMGAKVVVFENAPAAYTKSGQGVVDRLKQIANSHDYGMHLIKTDTLYHGVPQSRKRTFISFYQDNKSPLFNYENKPFKELTEYLKEVPKDAKYNDKYVGEAKDIFYEYLKDAHKDKGPDYYSIFKSLVKEGSKTATSLYLIQCHNEFTQAEKWFEKQYEETGNETYKKGIKIIKHCKKKVGMGKGYWDSSSYIANDGKYTNAVISKNMHRCIHPKEERGLTVRELMWLMGHPHDFEFSEDVKYNKSIFQISQNVPVNTAAYIAGEIKKYLNNELKDSGQDFVKQNNLKQIQDV